MAALTSSFLGLSAPLKTVAKRTVAPKALPVKADLYPGACAAPLEVIPRWGVRVSLQRSSFSRFA